MSPLPQFLLITSFLLLLFLFPSEGKGQGICAFPIIKVSKIEGRVLANTEGIFDASIDVLRWKNQQEVVRTGSSDKDGGFDISGIKNGKYYVLVRKELFSTMIFPIDLNSKKKKRRGKLLIHMALDFEEPCSRGGAELVKS